jgi:anti-sigma regulatory factor (Ser/Thr protein kinase)
VLERFRLAVSELVTNAIKHAGLSPTDQVRMIVRLSEDRIRVEVSDAGPGFDANVRPPGPTSESGRGLWLVQGAADRCGITTRDGEGQWFEIDLLRDADSGSG